MARKNNSSEPKLRIGQIFNHTYGLITVLGWLGVPAVALFAFFRKSAVYIIFPAIFLLFLVLLHRCRTHSRRIISWIMDFLSPNFSYRLSLWDVEYEYKSMEEMRYKTKYIVHALSTGVDHIRIRFNWSGSPDVEPKPVINNDYQTSKLEFDGMEYGYKFYKVFSRTSFNKSEGPIILGVFADPLVVKDPTALSPHLLTSISMPTDCLTMRVILPYSIHPKSIEFLEYLHATDDFHWHKYDKDHPYSEDKITVETVEGKWIITWDISYPVYGGKYLIKWVPEKYE